MKAKELLEKLSVCNPECVKLIKGKIPEEVLEDWKM